MINKSKQVSRIWIAFAIILMFFGVKTVIEETFFKKSSDTKQTVSTVKNTNVPIPEYTAEVVDTTGDISEADQRRIKAAIQNLEKATGGQMAVLFVDTLKKQPIEEYSIAVCEKWKIGKKGKDNGALLLFVLKDHDDRLEVGYGWEGAVNDARAGDLLRAIVPQMRQGKYADAAIIVINGVGTHVAKDMNVPFQPFGVADTIQKKQDEATENQNAIDENREDDSDGFPIVTIFIIICFILVIIFSRGGWGHGGHFGGGGGGFSGGGGGGFDGGGGGSFGGGGASGKW